MGATPGAPASANMHTEKFQGTVKVPSSSGHVPLLPLFAQFAT